MELYIKIRMSTLEIPMTVYQMKEPRYTKNNVYDFLYIK